MDILSSRTFLVPILFMNLLDMYYGWFSDQNYHHIVFITIIKQLTIHTSSVSKSGYLVSYNIILIIDHTSLCIGRVPTQISFSNSLCFPCTTANFLCANLRDLCLLHTQN